MFFLWVNTNVPSTFQSCWLRGSSRPRVHTCSHRWSAQTLSGAYTAAHTSPATLYYSHAALSSQPEVESAVLPSNSSGVESALLSVVKFRAQAGCFVSWVPSRPALICFRFQLNGCIVQSALSFWQCQPIHSTTTYILTTHHHLQLAYFPLQSIDLLLQLVILFVQSFLNCIRRTLSARMLPGSSNRWLFDPLVEAMVRQCLLLSIIDD